MQLIHDTSPGIDDHGVTVRFASADMVTTLCGGDDVGQVFNCARAHQRFPMHLAGGRGKRGRQHDDVHVFHGAEYLGETQVVAHSQTDASERTIDHHDLVARLDRAGFVVVLVAQCEVK